MGHNKNLIGILIFACIFLAGCMSQDVIDRELSKCPLHVQENVGEIKYYPFSWGTAMLMSGVTDPNTGEIWLTLWSDKHALLHEIAHSVYFRTPNHKEFARQFAKKKGFVSIWSLGTKEEIAEAFVEGMKGRRNDKIDMAMNFFDK